MFPLMDLTAGCFLLTRKAVGRAMVDLAVTVQTSVKYHETHLPLIA